MYAELRTGAGEVLATLKTHATERAEIMARLARKAGLVYTVPALWQHFPGGGTYHVQYGRRVRSSDTGAATLGPRYVVWIGTRP